MEILYNDDKSQVSVHSSIDQFKDFISVYIGGRWVPVEFDEIDYIECGKIHSHPVIVDAGDNIGYIFENGSCTNVTDIYPTFEREGTELRELPECMGDGFYEAYFKQNEIVNFDDGTALSIRNVEELTIGQHYYLADEILPADDVE